MTPNQNGNEAGRSDWITRPDYAVDNTTSTAIKPDPIVDPAVARDLVIDNDFVPRDVNELVIGVTTLMRSVRPENVETMYSGIKGLLKKQAEEAVDATANGKNDGVDSMVTSESHDVVAENVIRTAIRKIINESDAAKKLAQVKPDNDVDDDDDAFGDEPVSGVRAKVDPDSELSTFAGELDTIDPRPDGKKWSVSGAKQAIDKATRKAQFLAKLQAEKPRAFERMVDMATADYIDYLESSKGKGEEGDIPEEDIRFMRKNPDFVQELDGFRDFLHNYVRHWGYKSDTDSETEF